MKNLAQAGFTLLALVLLPGLGRATVATYPAPPGLAPGDAAQQSSMYQVRVIQGGVTNESFVYQLQAPAGETKSWRYNICSFTTFSFDGTVTVEVTKFSGAAIVAASVHPVSYGIPATVVSGTKATFQLSRQNAKMAVIFNNDWKTHPLMIFAEELEVNPPPGPSANVIYYGPGVHSPGRIVVTSGKTLYLAGGAYVKGWIDEGNVSNVKVIGRGILSAEDRPDNGTGATSKTIRLDGSGNCEVNGIMTAQNVGFGLDVGGANNLIKNYKHLGCWHPTTDGINMGDDTIVEDCYISANDDGIKCYQQNVIVRRIVFWQMENGACFQIGWGGASGTRRNIRISEIDVIRKDSDPAGGAQNRVNNSIISCVDGGSSQSYDWVFENIRCETVNGRLFSLEPDTGVSIRDFTIRNFSVANWNSSNFYNTFDSARVHDITFENLMVNGQLITQPAQADIRIQNGAYNIFFTVTNPDTNAPGVTVTSPTNGASFAFGAAVPVVATVTDNTGVANAQLLVDGVPGAQDGSPPYQFTATGLAAGSRVLSVVGTDTGGNRATNSVTITVQPQTDFNPPVVTLTTPTNGASFTFGAVIPVAATVTDDVAVAEAQLRVDGQLSQTDTNAPYEFNLTGILPGNHLLAVVGRDTSFNSATSSVTITVLAPPANNYSNLDFTMSTFNWKPATNPAPPHPDANINFSSATNTPWEWDDSSGAFATATYEINRTTTAGPSGAEVYFFGGFQFHGSVTSLRMSADVSRSTNSLQNVGNFHFALRQGTNLFYTSAGLNNVPSVAGPVVNYDLAGLTTATLKTNGVNALAGLVWTSQYAGQAINFANGLPIEFGFRSTASLGASATSTLRGPQLDNFRVEITGLSSAPPPSPTLTLEPAGGGQWQLTWNAAGFDLQSAPHVAGPWSDVVPPAISPHLISPTNAAGYYRLEWTAP